MKYFYELDDLIRKLSSIESYYLAYEILVNRLHITAKPEIVDQVVENAVNAIGYTWEVQDMVVLSVILAEQLHNKEYSLIDSNSELYKYIYKIGFSQYDLFQKIRIDGEDMINYYCVNFGNDDLEIALYLAIENFCKTDVKFINLRRQYLKNYRQPISELLK